MLAEKLHNLSISSFLLFASSRTPYESALPMSGTDVCSYSSKIRGLLFKSKIGSICSSLCPSVVLVSVFMFGVPFPEFDILRKLILREWWSACELMQLWLSKGCGEKWIKHFEEPKSLEEGILLFVGWGTYLTLSSSRCLVCMGEKVEWTLLLGRQTSRFQCLTI